jgi:hypothetical protein
MWRVSRLRRRAVAADRWGVPDRNAEDEPICRWCRGVVRPPRRTFCGDACVHEWKLRSDPQYVRDAVWRRDGGVCRLCALDVRKAERRWEADRPPPRARAARRRWRARVRAGRPITSFPWLMGAGSAVSRTTACCAGHAM